MKMKDMQLKEELRWRDENQAAKKKTKQNKTIEENITTLLQKRDEEWKEEL